MEALVEVARLVAPKNKSMPATLNPEAEPQPRQKYGERARVARAKHIRVKQVRARNRQIRDSISIGIQAKQIRKEETVQHSCSYW